MIATIAFRVFFVCLFVCACMVLGGIWFEHQIESARYFQATATLFVTGLASFLTWFSLTLRAIHARLHIKQDATGL